MSRTVMKLWLSVTAAMAVASVGACDGRPLDPLGQAGSGGTTMPGDAGASGTWGAAGTGGAAGNGGSMAGSGGGAAGTDSGPAGSPGTGGTLIVAACGSTTLAGLGATGTIAFDSDREDFNRDIYTIRVDGSDLTRLTSTPGIDKEPSFAPDGGRISFTSDRSGKFQIHLLELATMQVTQLTNVADAADQSSFSRDGRRVAFHSGASVWLINTDGTGLKLVATGLDTFNAYFWPHFSADDSELVFDRNNEIDAARIDGSGMRQIVQNWTTTIKSPAVSPGGADVAYDVYCTGGPSIWTTPFSAKTNPCEGRRVTPVGEPDGHRPTWGPNNLIAYERVDRATNVGAIAVISRVSGSVPCLLTPDASDSRNPAWSF